MTENDTETPVPPRPEESSDTAEAQPTPSASDPLKAAADFVKQHPGLTIAGAISAGLLAGALIPKRNRERLFEGGNRLAKNGAAFGRNAWERAEHTGAEFRERGSAASDLLERFAEIAIAGAGKLLDSSEDAATKASRNIARKASELKSKIHR